MAVHEIETLASKSQRSLACFVVLAVVLTLTSLVSAQPAVPLPADVTVEAPGPDVSPELAKFASVWGNGAWDGLLAHVLVVEQVRPDGQAPVVYAYGDAPDWNVTRGHARVTARVEGGALTFDLRGGRVRVQYRFEGESLRGTYTIGDRVSTVTLVRTTVADLAKTPAPPGQVAAGGVETVRIPLTESGFFGRKRVLTLEGTLYRPTAEGPRPVLIFNHGSTGPGAIPPTLTQRYSRQAAFFVERGFALLVPMRRGRGASEGSYAEGYGCEGHILSAGIARAVEDLDAVIAWVRQQPWADAQRIMMGGISRGGILSVVYAAERPGAVRGVINFVGRADLIRGLRNYLDFLEGRKKLEQLRPEELREVLEIHRRLQGSPASGGSGSSSRPSYEIEVAHNDELFIINGEKFEAKTYCLGWDVGDRVIFLEGSPYGACASAKLLNLRNNQVCEVWCE